MKLIIQIPCYNEEETLPETVADLPAQVEGFDVVEYLVIDDGSTDQTSEVARQVGVHHVIRSAHNRGLADAFRRGLDAALRLGADVIVNTDGDNQYRGESIQDLVGPILADEADIVVGDRGVSTIAHFSRFKKILQILGSMVVRWTSGTGIPDATSGARAISREAALQLVVYSNYTYTLETIIQAGKRGLVISSVPIKVNEARRASRLIKNIPTYVVKSAITILRIFLMYEALRTFLLASLLPFAAGLVLVLRFGIFYLQGQGEGHIQSLILAAVLLLVGFITVMLGLLADIIARNRQLNEELLYRVRKRDYENSELADPTA